MKTLIFLLGLTGSISTKTHNILHKRNTVDSVKTKDLIVENTSDSEVLEVPLREYEDDNKPIPIHDVWAVKDGRAELPCDIRPPDPTDQVYLVLWYRELAGKPLYSYDLRGRPPGSGKHWSAEPTFGFGSRANFRLNSGSNRAETALVIKKVTLMDEGVYRCRVDYRNSPTRNMKLNLTVVEEPHAPQIKRDDELRQDVGGAFAGPFNEGEELRLLCEVHGGRPLPSVYWYVGGRRVEGRTQIEPGKDVVLSRLRYSKLSRDMNNKKVSCEAKNNDINDPKTRTVTVQMNLRPQSVKILRKETYLTEGAKVQIVCEARGSEPPAQIRWYLGETPLENTKIKHNPLGSTTTSILMFEPGETDNKRRLSCRAFNKNIPGSTIEDHWDILVQYKPRLALTLGRTLNPSEIKEKDDVYFECRIVSNPEATKLEWYHEEQRLFPNASGGILLSNQSLVIQGVQKRNNGAYTCRAQNSQGEATSNTINLSIKYRPVCDNKTLENNKIAVDMGGVTIVDCYLDSNPPVRQVYWISSKQGHQARISPTSYTLMEGFSRLSYQPDREADYGELLCYGVNGVGSQIEPCVFSIEAAGRPYPPEKCRLMNETKALFLICSPGFDGGLTQSFNLEIYISETRSLVRNMTSNQPRFQLSGIHTTQPVSLLMYAWNKKGRSEVVPVREDVVITVDTGSQSTELPPSVVMKEPLFFVIGGAVLGFLVITLLSLIWYLRRRSVGKKLAVVEVCVGKVDRVRSRHQLQEPGDSGASLSSNNNQHLLHDNKDIQPYDSSVLASISSDQSTEDISNLQLKGSSALAPTSLSPPTASADTTHTTQPHLQEPKPTKPILKKRTVDYSGQGRVQGRDGTWYSNPLDCSYYPANTYHQDSCPGYSSGYSTLQSRLVAPGPRYQPARSDISSTLPHHRIPPPSGFTASPSAVPRHRNLAHIGTLPRQSSTDTTNYRAVRAGYGPAGYGAATLNEKEFLMSSGCYNSQPESNI